MKKLKKCPKISKWSKIRFWSELGHDPLFPRIVAVRRIVWQGRQIRKNQDLNLQNSNIITPIIFINTTIIYINTTIIYINTTIRNCSVTILGQRLSGLSTAFSFSESDLP